MVVRVLDRGDDDGKGGHVGRDEDGVRGVGGAEEEALVGL
jgi:hypothetical protein